MVSEKDRILLLIIFSLTFRCKEGNTILKERERERESVGGVSNVVI